MNSFIKIIVIPIIFIIIGTTIYSTKFYDKNKPKLGQERNTLKEYLNDIFNFKLYFQSIILIVIGVLLLFAFIIIEILVCSH